MVKSFFSFLRPTDIQKFHGEVFLFLSASNLYKKVDEEWALTINSWICNFENFYLHACWDLQNTTHMDILGIYM